MGTGSDHRDDSESRAKPSGDCADAVSQAGRGAFPKISWSEADFARAWHAFGAPVEHEPATLLDEYLRIACLARAAGAVETLELQFIVPLRATLVRRCGDPQLVDEALQTLRQKLLLGESPRLQTYQSTGHLRAWLQVVGVRVCQDLARQRGARWARESALRDDWPVNSTAVDVAAEREELDALFVEALREVIRGLPARERYALRMHVLAGWNVSQIGEALSIHRASAARWIVAAKEKINENVRALLAERLDLDKGELERVLNLFSTKLDIRLSRLFETTPALGLQAADSE